MSTRRPEVATLPPGGRRPKAASGGSAPRAKSRLERGVAPWGAARSASGGSPYTRDFFSSTWIVAQLQSGRCSTRWRNATV